MGKFQTLAQIDEKSYADKFDFTGKKLLKLGISFSSEKRTITDWRLADNYVLFRS